MNKSFRVIWSSVRNCFVVADERSKAKGKPSSTKKVIAAAVAGLFLAPAIASAATCEGLNPVTGALTTTQCYTVDEDITINNGASVNVGDGSAVAVLLSDYTKALVNNGSLSGAYSDAVTATGDEFGSSGVAAFSYAAYNAGLYVDDVVSGALTNTSAGVINSAVNISAAATATDTNYAYAYAYANYSGQSYSAGILSGELNGELSNSGTIGAAAVSSSTASATVSSTSTDVDDRAYVFAYSGGVTAAGVVVSGDLNGSLINNAGGVIGAQASDTASAIGAINNGGTSTGDAYLSSTSRAYSIAYGVTIDGAMGSGSSLVNRGVINAAAASSALTTSAVPLAYDYAYAYAGAGAYASAYGMHVNSTIGEGALVHNAGTINVTANTTATASASSNGNLTNLTYRWDSPSYYDSVVGHWVYEADADASEAGARGYAYAYGVLLNRGVNGGAFVNDGAINVTTGSQNTTTATGYSDDVWAYTYGGSNAVALGLGGFYDIDSNWTSLLGTVTNNGTLNATSNITSAATASSTTAYDNAYAFAEANSGGWADATGIYLSGYMGVDSRLINNGTINASANMNSSHGVSNATVTGEYSYAYAYAGARGRSESVGIRVRGLNDNASIVNNGVISSIANTTTSAVATASASPLSEAYAYSETNAYASAYGIVVGGYNTGMEPGASVVNNGDITVMATVNTTATSTATGDTATADAYAYAYAYATGMHSQRGLEAGASFVNNGTITVVANANATATAADNTEASMYARAYGMNLRWNEVAEGAFITNTGTISATAIGNNNLAVGININSSMNGDLNNSGNITATTQGGAVGEDYAFGVYANNLNGTITNSGNISATVQSGSIGEDNAYSIFVGEGGNGMINNLAGGVLDGQVYAGGGISMINDGMLNTRFSESYIGEDYTQGSTGVLKLSALDDMTYGSLYAGGMATMAEGSTIRVALDPAHTLVAGSVLENVVYGNAGLTMGAVNVQDNNLSLNFTAVNDLANGVDLTAAATGLTTVAATVAGAGLGSAAGLGGVLDGLLVNPDAQSPQMANFLWNLGSSSSAQQVTNSVAELLPLMSGSVNYATLNTLRMVNLAINQRLDASSGVSSGDLAFSDKHFWLKPFGSWANQDKRNGTLGYDSNSYGLAFGADGQISDANTVGVAIAYARTDMDSDMVNQRADINSYQAAFYGSHKLSDVTSLNYQADFGYHDNSGRRSITGIGSAKSDFDSWSGHVGVSLAHSIALDELTTFTPSIRADYSKIRAESYREKGAGAFNLNVGSETTDELILGADGKLARSLSDKATAYANLGLGYDVINERTSLTSAFAGIPGATFATPGLDPSPWLVRGGLGVVGQATETLELSLRYDFEVRNDFDNQTASVKARWAF